MPDVIPIPDNEVLRRIEALPGPRSIVALAGAPGSGKSSYAGAVSTQLNRRGRVTAAVLQMDGYHLDNAVLDAHGWRPRKGAPHTFDVDGLARDIERLRQSRQAVLVPVFDRALDLSRAAAREIPPECSVVIVEGNYLLLDDTGWRDLRAAFDLTIALDVPLPVLEARLMARWRGYGFAEPDAAAKVLDNDLPNARLVIAQGLDAQLRVPN